MLRDKVLQAQLTDEGIRKIKEKKSRGIKTPFQILPEGLVVIGK
jgi:uncharacterized protein with GYD domain